MGAGVSPGGGGRCRVGGGAQMARAAVGPERPPRGPPRPRGRAPTRRLSLSGSHNSPDRRSTDAGRPTRGPAAARDAPRGAPARVGTKQHALRSPPFIQRSSQSLKEKERETRGRLLSLWSLGCRVSHVGCLAGERRLARRGLRRRRREDGLGDPTRDRRVSRRNQNHHAELFERESARASR